MKSYEICRESKKVDETLRDLIKERTTVDKSA